MDKQILLASQQFNGGIVFVSFVISTVGALTTFELLGRRTHISGIRNWLLLAAASLAMGGVGIWSMHFVGNNSLVLVYNGTRVHLNYTVGYTFASLVVAIACMFVSFAFVGVTEEVKVMRIVPSGVIAGLGIACMHYIGQFAIEFFHLRYKIHFIAAASIIACVAVVTALYIFFKLRELWANRWYKRLGASMLMGCAVCGMHYTAMVGTEYVVPLTSDPAPDPVLSRAALIGTISGIVVLACAVLLITAFRSGVVYLPAVAETRAHRLMLDVVFFDRTGKILVNVEGRVPSREITADIKLDKKSGNFNSSHPLFIRLFEATTRWAKLDPSGDNSINRGSEQSSVRTRDPHDVIEGFFMDAARDLVTELRLGSLADLGIMFDSVINTNTIATRRHMFLDSPLAKKASRDWRWWKSIVNGDNHHPTNDRTSATMLQAARENNHQRSEIKRLSSVSSFSTFESAVVLEQGHHHLSENKSRRISFHSFAGGHRKKRSMDDREQTTSMDSTTTTSSSENQGWSRSSSTGRTSEANDTQEDRHVVVVRRISKKEQSRLLSQGYRFADPMFISKTMGEHLKIPSDHMSLYFNDMQLLALSAATLLQIKPGGPGVTSATPSALSPLSDVSSASSIISDNDVIPDKATKGSVYVGLSVLFQEDRQNDPMNVHIMVDKMRRYAFPMVRLVYDDDEMPVQLSREERTCIFNLEGQSLQNICAFDSRIRMPRESGGSSLIDSSRSTGDWATRSDGTSGTFTGSSSPQMTSPVLSGDNNIPNARFIRALESASQQLMNKSVYGKPLASISKLQSEVIDIPPFSLTLGPCQLILFRGWVTSPGTVSAINQTSHEATKCIPVPLYRSLAYYITDQATLIYKSLALRNVPESAYMAQQRVYQSTASSCAPPLPPLLHPAPGVPLPPVPEQHTGEKTYDESSKAPRRLTDLVSLPPPPRARKPKNQLLPGGGLALASLEDIADKVRKSQSSTVPLSIELPTILTILPTFDRFWWLNNVIDETIHGN